MAGGLLFLAWLVWSFQAHGVPDAVYESDARVRVEEVEGSWRFAPVGEARPVGLVWLPGGMVDPRAYTPIARALAEAGYPVVLVELPFRMARTPEREQQVLERARAARRAMGPDVPWVLAGHSRGAAIATRLMADAPAAFDGLALVGTTHPRVNLSALSIPVYKIGGTSDCVAPRADSEAAAGLLPPHTEWRWIDGANHAQFGYYGSQLGDCGAEISRERQQEELHATLVELLGRVEGAGGS